MRTYEADEVDAMLARAVAAWYSRVLVDRLHGGS